jgi:hypothetical protein
MQDDDDSNDDQNDYESHAELAESVGQTPHKKKWLCFN